MTFDQSIASIDEVFRKYERLCRTADEPQEQYEKLKLGEQRKAAIELSKLPAGSLETHIGGTEYFPCSIRSIGRKYATVSIPGKGIYRTHFHSLRLAGTYIFPIENHDSIGLAYRDWKKKSAARLIGNSQNAD